MKTVGEETPQPASEVVQPTMEDQHDANLEAAKENSTSVFVNSEPMREEQVQNAVKFLSHPKVKGSPVIYRRSFLERKGLTKEEIDEAFRRVPDPPPTVLSGQNAGTSQDGQLKPSSNVQPQPPTQALQPGAAPPSGVISKVGTFQNFRFSHALIAIGFLAASGAGTAVLLKKAVVPRLKSWICKVVLEEEEEDFGKKTNLKPSLGEETAAAAKAAAAAAADAAKASQEILIAKTEEKRYFGELMKLLDMQVQEMKSMSISIRKLEGQSSTTGRSAVVEQEDHRVSSWQPNANGKQEFDLRSARSLSPPASVEPSAAPHPKSYMEIMAMVQRGERPPNIREINDLPPNPNQPVSNPRLAPRAKPWEVPHPQNSSSDVLQSQENGNGSNSKIQDNGLINHLNGDTSLPWWQRKNARITEIETEDEPKSGFSGVLPNDRPVQRSWVPPQPPPVVMPEAAAAIRQPKKSTFQNELTDDQLLARSSDVTDELQRVTKVSELGGGVVEANGGGSKLNTSEIQEEDEAL